MKQVKIKTISKIEHNSKRYDISVADNNNLFANDILIHNCQNIPHVLEQFKDKEVYVTEKIDCLDENTLILTVQGLQTIKEICESDSKTFVLSQDIETKKVSFKPVLNKIIKPNESKQWIKITLEDNTELLVTDDHKVWLPDLQCYRQVKDLTEKDFLLKLC